MIKFYFKIRKKSIFVVNQIEFNEICYTTGFVRSAKDIFVLYKTPKKI